jgi:hypothetical protein
MARASVTTRYERTRYYLLGKWFERLGWLAIAGVSTAAALGAFGGGWLSDTEVSSADGAVVARYERFWRSGTPFDFQLAWRARPGEATVFIDTAYLEHFVVEVVMPQPLRVAFGAGRIYYTFAVADDARSGQATFRLAARESGAFGGQIGVAGGGSVAIRQRIYP